MDTTHSRGSRRRHGGMAAGGGRFPGAMRAGHGGRAEIRRCRGWIGLLVLGLATMVTACRTDGPASRTLDPAWEVRLGQAVWRPAGQAGEVTGDVVYAADAGGSGFFLEFSKPAVSLVQVLERNGAWELAAPGTRTRRGRGRPPNLVWFQLGALLQGRTLGQGWEGGAEEDGDGWWLESRETGERLAGYLGP